MHQTIKLARAAAAVSVIVAMVGVIGPSASNAETVPRMDLATTICRGIAGCTPVVSGWIAVPGGTMSKPGSAETTVACQGSAIAVNFGATSPSDSRVDVNVDAVIAIINGIPYDRTFEATNTAGASTFQAAVGCVNIGSSRVSGTADTVVSVDEVGALSPGQSKDYSVSCPDGRRAVDGEADVAFDTGTPPPTAQIDDISYTSAEHGPDLTVTIRTSAALKSDDHPELELMTECQTGA